MDKVVFEAAQLSDQGKLGELLINIYGEELNKEIAKEKEAGFYTAPMEDELMAADDFYFSTIDLMDCCYLAKIDQEVIGAACINPYTAELQYIAVLQDYRRKGIAKKLTLLALKELFKRGCDHVKINFPIHFYETGAKEFLESLGLNKIKTYVTYGKKLSENFK